MLSKGEIAACVHPRQAPRFLLALVFAIVIFPLIAALFVVGTVFLIVPIIALFVWIGMRIWFAHLLGNSILVSTVNYPRINTITEQVKQTLGYGKRVYVFVHEQGSFNALLQKVFFRRAVFLNSEVLESGVSDEEVRWIVGRFVGYLLAQKRSGFFGWIIRVAERVGIFNFFILPFERAMVYTGDRLALAAIDGDISTAISAMQKLFVGRELGYSINPQGMIDQHRNVKGSFFAFLARLLSAFPHMTARYVDLIVFAQAKFPAQYAKFAAANPGLPSDLARLRS